ncbi:hypothetical protein NL676_030041 [Syzygium grande]|nr:hypothetical protein NL676_030041 [Syzygium grande]
MTTRLKRPSSFGLEKEILLLQSMIQFRNNKSLDSSLNFRAFQAILDNKVVTFEGNPVRLLNKMRKVKRTLPKKIDLFVSAGRPGPCFEGNSGVAEDGGEGEVPTSFLGTPSLPEDLGGVS